MFVISDLGANINKIIDDPDPSNIFNNLIALLGQWHYNKNVLEAIYQLLQSSGFESVAKLCGWESEPQYLYLCSCGAFKKSQSIFRDVWLEAQYIALIDTITALNGGTKPTVEEILLYISDDLGDVSFQNHMHLLFMSECHDTLCDGVFFNQAWVHHAARIATFPLLFARKHDQYCVAALREAIMIFHQWSDELRQHYSDNFAVVGNDGKGSSQDDICERLHDRQKSAMSSDSNVTEQAIKKANYYIEYAPLLKNGLYQNCGACKRRSHLCDLECDLSKVTNRVATVLRKSRYMEKIPGRLHVLDINGKVIPDNRTPLFSEAKGMESLKLNLHNSINEIPFEWASELPIKMKDDSPLMIARREAAVRKRQLKKLQKEAASSAGVVGGVDMLIEENDESEDEEFGASF